MKQCIKLSMLVAALLVQQTIESASPWTKKLKTAGKVTAGLVTLSAAKIGYDVNRYINQCNENCQTMQDTLDLAIALHKQDPSATAGTTYVTQVTPPFGIAARVRCRENYESKHPGVFQKTPARIGGTENESWISIEIFSREQADQLSKTSHSDDSHEI